MQLRTLAITTTIVAIAGALSTSFQAQVNCYMYTNIIQY